MEWPKPDMPDSIQVSATTTATEGKKQFTLYVILIKWRQDIVWTVNHRFSEFVTLRDNLCKSSKNIPALPAKTWLRSFGSDFVEKRRKDLQKWLNDVIAIPFVINAPEFLEFLEVKDNVDISTAHLPKQIKVITDPAFGVNAFIFDEDDKVMFTACEDAHMISRLDSALSNLKMPWEKERNIVPIGSFNCWRIDENGHWASACNLFYDCQVTAVAWDSIRRYVMVGLQNGHIIFYFVDAQYKEFTVVNELAIHEGRISKLVYVPERDLLLSCARDKKLAAYDLKKESLICQGVCGKAWLSSLEYDSKSNHVYMGTYGTTVEVWDISCAEPKLLHTLNGHAGSVRCLFYDEPSRYLFSGGFDCVSGIWKMFARDEVTRSRSVGWLQGGPSEKIKSIVYLPSSKQVVNGLDNGRLVIWDTKTGKINHVVKAHSAAIVALKWLDIPKVLMSGARDGKVKFWKFPEPLDHKTGLPAGQETRMRSQGSFAPQAALSDWLNSGEGASDEPAHFFSPPPEEKKDIEDNFSDDEPTTTQADDNEGDSSSSSGSSNNNNDDDDDCKSNPAEDDDESNASDNNSDNNNDSNNDDTTTTNDDNGNDEPEPDMF